MEAVVARGREGPWPARERERRKAIRGGRGSILVATGPSSITEMTRIFPPQSAQERISTAKTRLSSAAQSIRRGGLPFLPEQAPGGAGGGCGTTWARSEAQGERTPW